MDDETASDYVTDDSGWEDAAEQMGPSTPHHGGVVEEDAIQRMQQRIVELEARLGAKPSSAVLQATRQAVFNCLRLLLSRQMLRCFKSSEP